MDAQPLVTTNWLSKHLHDPNVRILDASWYLPGDTRDPKAEYALEHIPGAAFFDIDVIADANSELPHMMPPPDVFAAAVQYLGIGNDHHVIVYDATGVYSSPRVWWTFNAMACPRCSWMSPWARRARSLAFIRGVLLTRTTTQSPTWPTTAAFFGTTTRWTAMGMVLGISVTVARKSRIVCNWTPTRMGWGTRVSRFGFAWMPWAPR